MAADSREMLRRRRGRHCSCCAAVTMLAGLNAAAFHVRDGLQRQDRTARAQTALSLALWLAVHLRALAARRIPLGRRQACGLRSSPA
jgi:hypothetical protein